MSTEISLSGLIPNELYQAVINRLSNHTHSISNIFVQEIGFDRGPSDVISEDSNMLRLKYTIRSPELTPDINNPTGNPWTLTSLGRIEPERLSSEFSIRPSYQCPIIEGNPIEFVSALGYRRKFEHFKRGVQLVRGAVIIDIFQVYQNRKDEFPVGGSHVHVIIVTATIPSTSRSTTATTSSGAPSQELRNEACGRVREIAAVLKGLVDLGRVDPL